jgi:imidazolonepropionase-like amidohydrolase
MIRTVLAASAILALAQAGARAETVAITHAHVLTMGRAGDLTDATVVIRDGVIVSVGAGAAPSGARVLDVAGAILTPGLISASDPISTVEIEGVEATVDTGTRNDRLSAAFDIQYAVNPDSALIPVARVGGVTDAVVLPEMERDKTRRDMFFAGQGAVIHLQGGGADPIRKAQAAMVLDLGEQGAGEAGGSRAAEYVLLRAMLDEVRRYSANKAAYFKEAVDGYNLRREDMEALIPVVEGRMPLIVGVHRASDIRQVLHLAREQKLHVVLDGAEEGWRLAPEIAAAGVPVMLNAAADLPSSFEELGSTLENAARLNAAGVTVIIENPPLFEGGRTPRYDAGRAVAHGLPYGAALAALTINPAKVFGVADKIGSIEVGKDADLVVWSGDPLDTSGAPSTVFVKGLQMPLRSRDTDLRDRYLPQDTAIR